MTPTIRPLLGCFLLLALLIGFTGCAGHQTGTVVGQETPPPAAEPVPLPDLVVEEEVKETQVVPSAVPPGTAPEPMPEPILEPAVEPMDEPAPPPPAVEEADILPFDMNEDAASVFLLDIPFNFDQYSLRDDALAFVEVNASRIKEEGVGRILLEGRGDEVGTTDYNLVLGERRGQEVKRYLMNLGLDASRLRVVSFGKERPLCVEHSTDCWQMNRSVRFVVE